MSKDAVAANWFNLELQNGVRYSNPAGTPIPDVTAPSVPVLSATAVSSSQINISWTASTDDYGVAGYTLQRSLDNVTWTTLKDSLSLSHVESGRPASTLHYYRVRAYDAAGNQSAWATAQATTQAAGSGESTVSLSATAFGGTSSVVSGGIPLKPGQLPAPSVENVAVLVDGSPVSRYVESLATHPDGSVKSLLVQIPLSLATNETYSGTIDLRIGVANTAGTLSKSTIDYAWITNPKWLYCTDADHLCKSRVTGLPLIPLDHPSVPASWKTWLTTSLDTQISATYISNRPTEGNAEYEHPYIHLCRYLCTGSASDLRLAVTTAMDNSGVYSHRFIGGMQTYQTPASGYTTPDANPESIPGAAVNSAGITPEQYKRSISWGHLYLLTGWQTFKLLATHQGSEAAARYTTTFVYTTYANYAYGRYQARHSLIPELHLRLIGGDSTMSCAAYNNTLSPQSQGYLDRIVAKKAACKAFSETYDPADARYAIWGCGAGYTDGTGIPPTFSYANMPPWMLLYYLNVSADADIETAMVRMVEQVRAQMPLTPIASPLDSGDSYPMKYWFDSGRPASVADGGGVLSMMFTLPFAWAYAYTGNTEYRDIVDALARRDHGYDAGGSRTIAHPKSLGEMYWFAFHALAYRAGVAYNGWYE